MASFVLVHGSWHGAWCWKHLRRRLEDDGHRVVAPDLPAHGDDGASPCRVTLADYSTAVRRAAAALDEPAVVVGHSMGGMAVSQAITDSPGLFRAVAYLCAFVPLEGDRLVSLARGDSDTLLQDGIRFGARGMTVRPELTAELFYGDCDAETAEWAASRLRPDPYLPLLNRYRGTRPSSIASAYIECTHDRAISVGWQRAMAARARVEIFASMETSHSPFLSAPDELARHLVRLSEAA